MDTESFWSQLLSARTPESWLAILAGAVYVFYKSGANTRVGKAVEAGIAGVMSMAIGPDIVKLTGYPPALIHFLVAVGGFLVLDFGTSFLSDKTELAAIVRDTIRKWLGIGKRGGGDES